MEIYLCPSETPVERGGNMLLEEDAGSRLSCFSSLCLGKTGGFPPPGTKNLAEDAANFPGCFRLALPRLSGASPASPPAAGGEGPGSAAGQSPTGGRSPSGGGSGDSGGGRGRAAAEESFPRREPPSPVLPARIKPFLTGEGRGRLQGRGFPLVSVCVL